MCLEALAGKEVADVLDRNKVSGKTVVAMDTDEDTLKWIQKGVIAATIAQKPFTMAYYGVKMLDECTITSHRRWIWTGRRTRSHRCRGSWTPERR